jgi:putative membrane protein
MALLTVVLLIAAPRACAQTTISTADRDFIVAAAQGGMTEVKLGALATRQGTTDDIQAFGQMMVRDHTAINADLQALAVQKGVTLPDSLDAKHQGLVDKLTALAGAEFDAAYVADMIKGHKQDAKAFKSEAAETKDAEIKAFVEKSLPVVEAHLKRVTALKS